MQEEEMTKDKPTVSSFGELLRQYREKTFDERTHKCLSQDQLGVKLYEKAGLIVSRNKVGKWELGRMHIQSDERKILTGIISLLLEYRGISSLDEADRLLEAGGYKPLTKEEIEKIANGDKEILF